MKTLSMNNTIRSASNVCILSGLYIVASTGHAHAYIDPGSVGLIMTAILGVLGSIAYTFRSWIGKVRSLFSKDQVEPADEDDHG